MHCPGLPARRTRPGCTATRLEQKVFTDNAQALALYRRRGFVVEGTHRAYAFRDGCYADAHSMARLRGIGA